MNGIGAVAPVQHRKRIMLYIQRKGQGQLETVDQFETRKEARAMLAEYEMSDPSASYYISTRCCNNWIELQYPYEVVESADGEWIVLCAGFQCGAAPFDRSGCSSQVWPTLRAAISAVQKSLADL